VEKLNKNKHAKSLNSGPSLKFPNLEMPLFNWIMDQRRNGFSVSTRELLCKAHILEPNLSTVSYKTQESWCRRFRKRQELVLRRPTRIAQYLPGTYEAIRDQFAKNVIGLAKIRNVARNMVCNMDETAIYFDTKAIYTIEAKGSQTVLVRAGDTYSQRATLCVTVAADGTKLPLFIIFKGMPGGTIYSTLHNVLPEGIKGCVQKKGWMDERVMHIWLTEVWEPYVAATSNALLLLDQFKVHMMDSVVDRCEAGGTRVVGIPPGYTSVCQPCDVGVMKPLKDRLRHWTNNWKRQAYIQQGGTGKVPSPRRENIVVGLQVIWDGIPTDIIWNSFIGCGMDYEMEVNVVTDNESDADSE